MLHKLCITIIGVFNGPQRIRSMLSRFSRKLDNVYAEKRILGYMVQSCYNKPNRCFPSKIFEYPHSEDENDVWGRRNTLRGRIELKSHLFRYTAYSLDKFRFLILEKCLKPCLAINWFKRLVVSVYLERLF